VPNLTPGRLLAMVDALQNGTLDGAQEETVQVLQVAIPDLAEQRT